MKSITKIRAGRVRKIIIQAIKYLILLLLVFATVLPLYWMIVTSIKPESELMIWPPKWVPSKITLSSYAKSCFVSADSKVFLNSASCCTYCTNECNILLHGSVYACKKKFRGADAILMLILSSMMIPLHIRVIPMYLVSLNLGLQNTYTGIFLPISITGFGIFLMRQFFITLLRKLSMLQSRWMW